ncbi:MAG: hypothetical protein GDA50_05490 [Alphaproteobacteria bacterium GM202ARS2]|nr:hypothetical protein [Alphaproteobacteria bacterium GM202ARS2]
MNMMNTVQTNPFWLKWVKYSKYAGLYQHLCQLGGTTWHASFAEVERVLGSPLPLSARAHCPWWTNQREHGYTHACAWLVAGYETQDVDLDKETITFRYTGNCRVDYKPPQDKTVHRHKSDSASDLVKMFQKWDKHSSPRDKNAPLVNVPLRRADMYRE